jgi:hypothetical protein
MTAVRSWQPLHANSHAVKSGPVHQLDHHIVSGSITQTIAEGQHSFGPVPPHVNTVISHGLK